MSRFSWMYNEGIFYAKKREKKVKNRCLKQLIFYWATFGIKKHLHALRHTFDKFINIACFYLDPDEFQECFGSNWASAVCPFFMKVLFHNIPEILDRVQIWWLSRPLHLHNTMSYPPVFSGFSSGGLEHYLPLKWHLECFDKDSSRAGSYTMSTKS